MPVVPPSSWLFSLRLAPFLATWKLDNPGVCKGDKTIMLGEKKAAGREGEQI